MFYLFLKCYFMKNIIFIICLAIASLFLSSCKKDLMKDKNVLEMFSELDKIDFKNDSSLLCFKSNEDFEKVTSILETYVQKGTEKDYDIDDPILYAFEEKYNKNSLRRMIVKETELLESKDSLFENNDPDDRYVGDDIIRSILNERLAFRIERSFFIVLNGITVNYYGDTPEVLDSVYIISNNYSDSEEMISALENYCSSIASVYLITSDYKNMCDAYFDFSQENGNPYLVHFHNYSNYYSGISFKWTFGDGTSSNEASPSHQYPGTPATIDYDVKLTIYYNYEVCDECSCKVFIQGCKADFDYTHYNRNYSFQSSSSAQEPIINYLWYFGDGGNDQGYNVEHEYQDAGEYEVQHIIETPYCKAFKTKKIKVKKPKSCCMCVGYDATPRYIDVNNGKNKIKVVLSSYGVWPIWKITSKTKFYKVKNNNSLKEEKATLIVSSHTGTGYKDSGCSSDDKFDINKSVSQSNSKKAKAVTNPGHKTYIKKEGVSSSYKVVYNGQTYSGHGLSIHQDGTCED